MADRPAAAEALASAGTDCDLALALIEHEPSLTDPLLLATLQSGSDPASRKAVQVLHDVAFRGLEAVLAKLCPVPTEVFGLVDALVADTFRPAMLAALRKDFGVLTSPAAIVHLRLLQAKAGDQRQSYIDVAAFLRAARQRGREGARSWVYADLFREASSEIAMFAMYAVKQLIVIPLEEQTLDPLTPQDWLTLVRRYRDRVGVDVDYDRGLQFFIDIEPMCRPAPPWMRVEVMAALGWLFMNRPAGPGSDRAQNVEEAIQVLAEAIEETELARPPYVDARLHHFLGRAYLMRFDFDPLQPLLDARYHFEEARQLSGDSFVPVDSDNLQLDLARCYTEIGRRSINTQERREALAHAVGLLRPSASSDRPFDVMQLALALSLQAEFDEDVVREAIELIEPLLENPSGAPGGMFRQRDHYAHTRDTERWGWTRYIYAEVVLQARALGHNVAVTRAIEELHGKAAGLGDSLALSGEALGGSELLGDLLASDGQWEAAIDAYAHAPVAFPYHPHTVLGRELALTRGAQLYAKRAYCLARMGFDQEGPAKGELAQRAVLMSEQYRTGGLLIDFTLTELALSARTRPDRAALVSALRDLREAEMRSRLPREAALRPSESELGRALADARQRVEQAAQSAHLDFREVTAVKLPDLEGVVVPGMALVVSLSVPFGGVMIVVTAAADGKLRYTMRLTNLDSRTLRGLLETYLALLDAMSREDPAGEKELLANLSEALQRELGDPLSDLLHEIEVAPGSEVRFIGGGGSDSLPVNALCHRGSARALIDDFAVTVMPGLAMAARLATLTRIASGPSPPFLVVAAAERSDLEFAWLEAALVEAHTGARMLVGAQASRDRVLADLSSARVVHVAGHADADVVVPWRSKLVLADGDLTAAELIEGAAGLDEVILSGCETGYTQGGRAPQERAGLTGALLAAGCSTVVSTWWPVYDLLSCIVSAETYRVMREDGIAMHEALRRVQSWLRTATRDELLLWCDAQETHLPLSTPAGKDGRRILRSARDELQAHEGESPPFGSVVDWAGFYTLHAARPAGRSVRIRPRHRWRLGRWSPGRRSDTH